eukprot:612935-Amphidinium_carterae.2
MVVDVVVGPSLIFAVIYGVVLSCLSEFGAAHDGGEVVLWCGGERLATAVVEGVDVHEWQ